MKRSLLAILSDFTLAIACTGPQLHVPTASPVSVEIERERQLDFPFRSQIEQRRRVFNVYSRLRTAGTGLCADIDALRVLQEQQAKMKQEQQPEKKPEPTRRVAVLTHVKGRLMSSPPVVLQAEYFEVGDGPGTSRVIYPGNYLIEGEYRTLPLNQSFSGQVNALLQ